MRRIFLDDSKTGYQQERPCYSAVPQRAGQVPSAAAHKVAWQKRASTAGMPSQMRASAVGIDYDAMTARAAQMLQENESKAVKRPADEVADGEPPAKAAAGAEQKRPVAAVSCG